MAGENPVNDYFQGFFFNNGPGANLKLRERIALAQLMQKRAYPKTFGEGLSAIGDALGDRRIAVDLEKLDSSEANRMSRLGLPPVAGAASEATVPSVRSYAPDEANTVVPPRVALEPPPSTPPPQFPPGGLRPAEPAPATPEGVTRLSSPEQLDDFRRANPLPPNIPPPPTRQVVQPPAPPPQGSPVAIQPQQPAAPPPQALPPPETGPAPLFGPGGRFPSRQSAIQPPPGTPVMAGGEPDISEMGPADVATPEQIAAGRNAMALALQQQQAGRGGPPPVPTTRGAGSPIAEPAPAPAIRQAPPQGQIQSMPEQPGVVAGYVPPDRADPTGAQIVRPSRREMELRLLLRPHLDSPHLEKSPAYHELKLLEQERAIRQSEANEMFKAELTRTTKRRETRDSALVNQAERINAAREAQQKQPTPTGGPQPDDPALLGTPQSPQRTGPRADPVPPGLIPAEWSKDQAKKIAAAKDNLDAAKPELKGVLDLMRKVRAHPAKEASIGTFGGLAKLTASGQGFAALNEQLKGKNLVAAYQLIKGTGPVGEREGENIAKAQSALSTATTLEDYNDALDTLESTLRGAVERAERNMKQPVTAYQRTHDDPYAPDIGQIGTRNGKPVEYMGGDPSKDSSYRTVRR